MMDNRTNIPGREELYWLNKLLRRQFAVCALQSCTQLYYHCYTWVEGVKNIQLGSEIILVHYYCDRLDSNSTRAQFT